MAALAAAEAVANNDRVAKTITGYKSKLKKMRDFARLMAEEDADWKWQENVIENPLFQTTS